MARKPINQVLKEREEAKKGGTYKSATSNTMGVGNAEDIANRIIFENDPLYNPVPLPNHSSRETRKPISQVLKEREKAKKNGTYKSSGAMGLNGEGGVENGIVFENDSLFKAMTSPQYNSKETEKIRNAFQFRNTPYEIPTETIEPTETWQEFKEKNSNLLQSMEFSGSESYQDYLKKIQQNTIDLSNEGGNDAEVKKRTKWLEEQKKNLETLQNADIKQYVSALSEFSKGNKVYASKSREASKMMQQLGFTGEEIASLRDTYEREYNAERVSAMQDKVDADTGDFGSNLKHSIGSVGAGLVSGVGIFENLGSLLQEKLTGEYDPVDTNAGGYYEGAYRDRVRQNVTEDIHNADENGEVSLFNKGLGMMYNAGMSTADSMTAIGVSAATGGMINPLAIMGASAASSTSKDVFERTGSNEKAMLTGTLSGTIEALTEKVSLDKWYDIVKKQGKTATRSLVGNLLAQAGIEGSEEVAAELLNTGVDRLINGGKSEYDLNVKNYVANGMSEEEAKNQATRDFWAQVWEAGIIGTMAGGMGAGIGSGISTPLYQRTIGAEINESGGTDSVIDKAHTYDDYKVQKALNSYMNHPSDYTMGKLQYEMDTVDQIEKNRLEAEQKKAQKKEKGSENLAKMRSLLQKGKTVQANEENAKEEGKSGSQEEVNASHVSRKTDSVNVEESMKKIRSADTADDLVEAFREVESSGTSEQIETARTSFEYQSAKLMSTGQISQEELQQAQMRLPEQEAFELGRKNTEVDPERLNAKGRIAYNNGKMEYLKEQTTLNTISDKAVVTNAKVTDSKGQELEIRGLIEVEGEPMLETNGGMVSLNSVSFSNAAVQNLYNNASTKGSKAAADTYLNNYPAGMTVKMYDGVFEKFMRAGELGLSFEKAVGRNGIVKQYISEKGLREIYELGAKKKDSTKPQQIQKVKRKGGGKVLDERLSKTDEPLMKVFEKMAEKTSQDIVLRDKDMEGINGYFDQAMSEIVLNTESDNKLAALIHEAMGEFSEAWAGKEMQQFQTALLEWYFETQGDERINAVIENYQKVYSEKEGSKSAREAANEMINDALMGLFATKDGVQDFTDYVFENRTQKQAKTIIQKITDLLNEICGKIRSYLKEARLSGAAKTALQMKTDKAAELREQFFEVMDKAIENYQKAEIKEEKTENIKYSLAKNAKKELHKALYDKNYREDVLLRDESPEIMLAQKGVKNLPMVMKASHIRENVFTEEEATAQGLRVDAHTHYHGLGEKFFLKVIDGLDDVDLAYRGTKNAIDSSRRENYFLLISKFKDKNRNTVNVPVYINEYAQYNRVFVDVNKISTVFGRDNFEMYIDKQIKNGSLVRIKNRSIKSSERNALIAKGYRNNASNNSISETGENATKRFSLSDIDTKGRKLSNEQMKYFQDSKVKDEKGNLKVVYHGSPADFNAFSLEYLGTNGTNEGYGFYFTDQKNIAQSYADGTEAQRHQGANGKLFEVYLDIKKPLSDTDVTMTRSEFKKFLTELDKQVDEDGEPLEFLSNYGDVSWEGLDKVIKRVMDVEYDGSDSDVNMIHSIINGCGNMEVVFDVLRKTTGYDGIIVNEAVWGGDQKIYVAFHPEQIKSVDNQKPTSDTDIRHSLSDTTDLDYFWENYDGFGDVIGSSASILEEGAMALKGQEVDTDLIKKIARKMKQEYTSKINQDVFVDNLEKVFSYLQTQEKANYEDMIRVMNEVAMPVIEESTSYDPQEMQQYQEFKRKVKGMRIKLSDRQKDEIAYYYGSYENFRKKMFGTLTLVNDGTYLDNVWTEIADFSNGYLERDTNYAEQPITLVMAIEQMEPQLYNNFGADNQGVAMDLALRIYEEYFKAQADGKVKALQKRILHERAEWHSKVRKQYYEKLAEEKKKMKEKTGTINSRVAEVRAAYTASELEKKKKQQATKYRNNIKKTGADLIKWIEKPTDKQHVPDTLRKMTLEFLGAIDFISHRALDDSNTTISWREKMLSIQGELQKATDNKLYDDYGIFLIDLDVNFLPTLQEFLEKNKTAAKISQLDYSQLKTLDYLVKEMKRAITKANEFHLNDRYKWVGDAANQTILELGEKKEKKADYELVGMARDMFELHMIEPKTFFEMLGEGAESVFGELREGFNRRTWHIKEAQDFMEETLKDVKKKELVKWIGEKAEVHMVEATVADKKERIKLTTGQIMSLYLLGKRSQARKHILVGGIRASEVGKGKKRILQNNAAHLTGVQYQNIIDLLTPEQKALADKMQRFLAVNCAEWGNEASMKMQGYKKFNDDRYFPIQSAKEYLRQTNQDLVKEPINAIKNLGFTKSVKPDPKNPIVAEDILEVFTQHVVNMANYNAFAAPLEDAMKWFNYKNDGMVGEFYHADTVQKSIARAYGKRANDYFVKFIQEINGEVRKEPEAKITKMLTSNFKKASVMANARVAIQQPTAYMRAMQVLSPADLLAGAANIIKVRQGIKEAKENSAIALWKSWGYYETYMGQSIKQIIIGKTSLREYVDEYAGFPAQKADEITWGVLWNACKNEVKRKNKDLNVDSKEFVEEVRKRFDEVIDETQVVDTMLHKAQIIKSKNTIVQMEMAFMSEPTKSYNMLYRAGKKGKKKFARAALTYVLTGVLTSMAAAVADAFRDDDFEMEWGERWLEHFLENLKDLNPLNALPYVKSVISFLEGYDANRIDVTGLSNIAKAIQQTQKKMNDEGRKSWYGIAKNYLRGVSQLTGVPMYNVLRDVEALVETITEEKWEESE